MNSGTKWYIQLPPEDETHLCPEHGTFFNAFSPSYMPVLTVKFVNEKMILQCITIQMEPIQQYFPLAVFIMLYKVVLSSL